MVTICRLAGMDVVCFAWVLFLFSGPQAMAQTNGTPQANPTKSVESISDLFDVENLPRMKSFKTYLASSYDREGGNFDWGNYERIDGDEGVILDVTGPGAITRMWSANPGGVLRIYLDDDPKPVVEENFRAFLNRAPLSLGRGKAAGRLKKQVGTPGGLTSYGVIPFEKRCKVTLVNAPKIYYQVNYLLFDQPQGLPRFSAEQTEQASNEYKKIQQTLDWDWRSPPASWKHKKGVVKLASGAKEVIFDETGPLTIRQIVFTVKWPDEAKKARHLKEKLLLRGYWDDDLEIPNLEGGRNLSIKSPLAWFFMDFGGLDDYHSALIEKKGRTYAARFPMPVRQRALLELVNDSILDADEISYDIAYETNDRWDPSLAHFKAIYHGEDSTFGPDYGNYRDDVMYRRNQDGVQNYPVLRAWGQGHFVGCCFFVDWAEMPLERASCESDEAAFVDGDPKRTMWGTGNEDYLNDAWGFHRTSGLLSGGVNHKDKKNSFGYRFHLSDTIPFQKKLAFTLEHGSSNNCTGRYQSVAYYYLKPTGPNPFIDKVPPRDKKRYHSR
ncbi:MAG: DUF2961 domain-containing protein [Pirellulales bacterium]|nr:DUF2961 domain-containing protein [Pirellulales bacterium]